MGKLTSKRWRRFDRKNNPKVVWTNKFQFRQPSAGKRTVNIQLSRFKTTYKVDVGKPSGAHVKKSFKTKKAALKFVQSAKKKYPKVK